MLSEFEKLGAIWQMITISKTYVNIILHYLVLYLIHPKGSAGSKHTLTMDSINCTLQLDFKSGNLLQRLYYMSQ